jgi:Zn-dependent peptidase ImmA (M78 family)
MPSTHPIKGITLSGWKLLLDEKICRLPVNPFQIAENHAIKVLTYSAYCEATEISRNDLIEKYGYDGFTLTVDNRFLIFFDENNISSRIRWTVMHELCHIFLGHFDQNVTEFSRKNSSDSKSKFESDADELTARVLSPMVVAHFCCVSSLDELRKLTGLSREASLYRWKRLCYLRKIKKFLRHQSELEVLQQFQEFITEYLSQKVDCINQLKAPPADNPKGQKTIIYEK